VWFVKYDRNSWRVAPASRLGGSDLATRVVDGIRASFDGLGFASKYLGALLLVLFVLHLRWRLLQGPARATKSIALSAALGGWCGGAGARCRSDRPSPRTRCRSSLSAASSSCSRWSRQPS